MSKKQDYNGMHKSIIEDIYIGSANKILLIPRAKYDTLMLN